MDTEGPLGQGTYISLDAADTLSTIMVNSLPDPVLFFRGIGGLIESAAKAAKSKQPQVVVFGEAVTLVHAEANLCAYPLRSFDDQEDEHASGASAQRIQPSIPGEKLELILD